MKSFKKLFCIFVLLSVFVVSFALPASANAPGPAAYLTVTLSNLPDNAVYADLLIRISPDDPNFAETQSNDYLNADSKSTEIVDYSEDGFRSFTFHYKNARSNIKIAHYDELFYVDFCDGLEYQDYLTQYEDLRSHYRDIKIALLDKDFNIIVVSEAIQLPKEDGVFVFDGMIHYDFHTNSIDFERRMNLYSVIFGGFFSILIMLSSVGVETLLAFFFKFKGNQVLTILAVNVCSQIIMRILYFALPFTYFVETVILEILVYAVEFLIYKKKFKQVSTREIAGYTTVANTWSLILGILLDCYVLT